MPEYVEAHAEMSKFLGPATFPHPREAIKPLMRAIDREKPPLHRCTC
jgi:hypothetical protein